MKFFYFVNQIPQAKALTFPKALTLPKALTHIVSHGIELCPREQWGCMHPIFDAQFKFLMGLWGFGSFFEAT
jgi:hypothetical protein